MESGKWKAKNGYSPLQLAFIGDAYYSLYVRTKIIARGDLLPGQMAVMADSYENAGFQAEVAGKVQAYLTPEESDIMRRGRNAKPKHTPRNASNADYHAATGLETLIGYLYLQGRTERIEELLAGIFDEE